MITLTSAFIVYNLTFSNNGICDNIYNNLEHNWDGGDCCVESCGHELCYNNKFNCLDPKYKYKYNSRNRRSTCSGTCTGNDIRCGHRNSNFYNLPYSTQASTCDPCAPGCDCNWIPDPQEAVKNCLQISTPEPIYYPTLLPSYSPQSITLSPTYSPTMSLTLSVTLSPIISPTYSPTSNLDSCKHETCNDIEPSRDNDNNYIYIYMQFSQLLKIQTQTINNKLT